MRNNLNVIEICAGAGGQSLGLERAGFEHMLAVELDKTAAETLKINRPDWDVRIGDVADRTVWDPSDYANVDGSPTVDLFAGGVPCPPFSIAGKQLGSDDERDLFAWAVEQVAVIRPRAVMLENVRGLSMPRFAGYRQHVMDRFAEMGYHAEWRLLNSSDFGLPQLRPRFVLVAMSPDDFQYFTWPEPVMSKVTVGQALQSLMAANGWKSATSWARNANDVGPTIVGGSKKHGGADLGPTRAKQAWAKLGVNAKGIADAAPDPDDSFEVGPKLTLEMVATLQGWDNKNYQWNFAGRKTSIYRQIGNAFPPPVAFEIGSSIANALNHRGVKRPLQDTIAVADPIYKVLRSADDFLSKEQIIRQTDLNLTSHELDEKLSAISLDFKLERAFIGKIWKYKLGEFKAFIGQEAHPRHQYYVDSLNRIS